MWSYTKRRLQDAVDIALLCAIIAVATFLFTQNVLGWGPTMVIAQQQETATPRPPTPTGEWTATPVATDTQVPPTRTPSPTRTPWWPPRTRTPTPQPSMPVPTGTAVPEEPPRVLTNFQAPLPQKGNILVVLTDYRRTSPPAQEACAWWRIDGIDDGTFIQVWVEGERDGRWVRLGEPFEVEGFVWANPNVENTWSPSGLEWNSGWEAACAPTPVPPAPTPEPVTVCIPCSIPDPQPRLPVTGAVKAPPAPERVIAGSVTGTARTGSPTSIELQAIPAEIIAGEPAAIVIQLLDEKGFLVEESYKVTFSPEELVAPSELSVRGLGQTSFSSTRTGTHTVTATVETNEVLTATTSVTVFPAAPANVYVFIDRLQAGVTAPVTVTVTDRFGNVVDDGTEIRLWATNGLLAADHGYTVDGRFETMLVGLEPGPVLVEATVILPPVFVPVEVTIAGDTNTLWEAWTTAYGGPPTTAEWQTYAAENGIPIVDGVPIVQPGDVLTFYVPVANGT